ncbi:hypothetical protein C2G38_2172885 [Gigaspora rosea]|uniref:Uncharacterized protein n=1 Tax=Gigaspora rosea TaxID=44941 RepID=A0A397VK27_9GLOM|nr:hypothetical protein C2G38_2172885 [Gigaspora rosea]
MRIVLYEQYTDIESYSVVDHSQNGYCLRQLKRSLAELVSATSIALLQTKQRLSAIGIFGTNFELLQSVDNLENGLFGFDKLEALQKLGAKVVVTKVPRTGCIRDTFDGLAENYVIIQIFGGLDCRYLITHLPTEKSIVRTLTTIATPHHESRAQEQSLRSPQAENIVNQKELPRSTIVATKTDQSEPSKVSNKKSFKIPISFNLPNFHLPNFNLSLLNINLSNISLSTFDTPAYSNLTTDYCVNYFNKSTPNNPSVAYYSYDASTNVPICVKSAQWGKYMGTVECDHWDLTNRWRLKIGSSFDPVEFHLNVATFLATEGY